MGLLSELRDKMLKNITLSLSLADLNNEYIQQLSVLVEENSKQTKGKCVLTLKVLDSAENLTLEMQSKKFRVSPDNSLIESLEKMAELQFN